MTQSKKIKIITLSTFGVILAAATIGSVIYVYKKDKTPSPKPIDPNKKPDEKENEPQEPDIPRVNSKIYTMPKPVWDYENNNLHGLTTFLEYVTGITTLKVLDEEGNPTDQIISKEEAIKRFEEAKEHLDKYKEQIKDWNFPDHLYDYKDPRWFKLYEKFENEVKELQSKYDRKLLDKYGIALHDQHKESGTHPSSKRFVGYYGWRFESYFKNPNHPKTKAFLENMKRSQTDDEFSKELATIRDYYKKLMPILKKHGNFIYALEMIHWSIGNIETYIEDNLELLNITWNNSQSLEEQLKNTQKYSLLHFGPDLLIRTHALETKDEDFFFPIPKNIKNYNAVKEYNIAMKLQNSLTTPSKLLFQLVPSLKSKGKTDKEINDMVAQWFKNGASRGDYGEEMEFNWISGKKSRQTNDYLIPYKLHTIASAEKAIKAWLQSEEAKIYDFKYSTIRKG